MFEVFTVFTLMNTVNTLNKNPTVNLSGAEGRHTRGCTEAFIRPGSAPLTMTGAISIPHPLFHFSTMLITFGTVKVVSTCALMLALATLLYMNIGQMGDLYLHISEAKKEAALHLSTERLSTLTITKSDLASGKATLIDQKELRYNGSLYDIQSSLIDGDKLIFTVHHDEKEEGLISSLKEFIDTNLGTAPKNSKAPAQKQLIPFTDYIPAGKVSLSANYQLTALCTVSHSHPAQTAFLSVLKSPPQFV